MKLNRQLSLVILLISGFHASTGIAQYESAPSNRPAAIGVPTDDRIVAPSDSVRADSKAKAADALKWDQLDPKAIELAMKKLRNKSPFITVPPER